MNSITLFIILFIVPLTISYMDSFSINTFIDRLKSEGLFNIIDSIKKAYGQDVAIISCEELNKNSSGNCKKLVLDYIPNYDIKTKRIINLSEQTQKTTFIKRSQENEEKIIKSHMKTEIEQILKQNLSNKKSNLMSEKILSKVNSAIIDKIRKYFEF